MGTARIQSAAERTCCAGCGRPLEARTRPRRRKRGYCAACWRDLPAHRRGPPLSEWEARALVELVRDLRDLDPRRLAKVLLEALPPEVLPEPYQDELYVRLYGLEVAGGRGGVR